MSPGWSVRYWRVSSTLQVEQVAEPEPAEEPHAGSDRQRAATERHVLVVGAVRGRPLLQEHGRVGAGVAVVDARVVVLHVVVVGEDHPRRRSVRGLQRTVGLVERVPVPVVGERRQLQRLGPASGVVCTRPATVEYAGPCS